MNTTIKKVFGQLECFRRKASIAQIGGFRPPNDPRSSWFGGTGVGLPGESLPLYHGRTMFPLLQINLEELPCVPQSLAGIKLLVLFHNREEIPFDKPHGDGWLIREYASLEDLAPLPPSEEPSMVRPFPIRWLLKDDEAPGWEDAWSLVDLTPINEDEEASELFFERFQSHRFTKIGGYPKAIQHAVGLEDFVFQVGSEEKPQWMWADNGIAYYFKPPGGEWRFSCQFD